MKDIKITNDKFEDFVWMSVRYCIGRHTIAAAHHANTIGSILLKNPDCMSTERKRFISRDIMKCINDVINWRGDINMDGNPDNFDYGWFLVTVTKFPIEQGKVINVYIKDKLVEHTNQPQPANTYVKPIDSEYTDLIGWLKLAYALDDSYHHKVTTEYKGEVQEDICIEYPIRTEDGKYKMVWCPVKMVLDRVTDQYRVAEEYIIKVE